MQKQDFVTIADMSKEEILYLLDMAEEFERHPNRELLKGRVVATLFFEPSTRTRLSFETAVNRLGGRVIGFSDASTTSSSKGETLKDTIKMVSNYVDLIIMRHYLEGAARYASEVTDTPVINAGDGGRAYPVRTLADIAQVWVDRKHVSNMKIGFLGDFSNNACVKGILQCLNLYKGNEFYFISVNGKPLSDEYIALMDKREKPFVVFDNLFDILPELDVLYMTRIQRERFADRDEYERLKDSYVLTLEKLDLAKPDLAILHPL